MPHKYGALLLLIGFIILSSTEKVESGLQECYITTCKRSTPSVSFRLDPTVPSEWLPAIQSSVQAWNEAGAAFTFFTIPDPESENCIYLEPLGIKGPVALTSNYLEGGVAVRTSTTFNSNYTWSLSGERKKFDVQNTATHEFGHWLVLNDLNIYDKIPAFWCWNETMFPGTSKGETKKRTLEAGDIKGIFALYNTDSPPSVTVLSPDGGEVWRVGTEQTILWEATDDVGVTVIDLQYSIDGGLSWNVIATGLLNTGSFDWTIPDTLSNQARVKVIAYDTNGNQGEDISDEDFTISLNGPPTITSFTANPASVPTGGQSTISVQASDPDGDPLTYEWSATCGTLSSTTGPEDKTWTAPATPCTCTVIVIVTDPFYTSATSDVNIEVTSEPIVESPWPMFQHDPQHTGRSEYTGPQSIDVRWAYDLGFNVGGCGGASLQPVIGNGEVIYFGIGEFQCSEEAPWGKLYAFNSDGTVKWESFDFGSPVYFSSAIGPDGTIYVPPNDKGLYALNPDGTQKWRFYEEGLGSITGTSVGSSGIIYFIDNNQKLYSLNPDGSKNWVFCCGPRGGSAQGGPAIGKDGTIYVAWPGFISGTDGQRGELQAYSPNGTLKWSVGLDWGWVNPTAPSVGHDGTIYIANGYYSSVGWTLQAFNQDGEQIWQTPIVGPGSPQGSPAIDANGNIIVANNWYQLCGEITWCCASGLWAFSPGGDVIWTIGPHGGQLSNNTQFTQPIMDAQGTIFVAENVATGGDWSTTRLYNISQEGTIRQTLDVPGIVFSSPVIGADGHLYAVILEYLESGFYWVRLYAFGQ